VTVLTEFITDSYMQLTFKYFTTWNPCIKYSPEMKTQKGEAKIFWDSNVCLQPAPP
jgi:hypothetical protein